MKAVSKFQKITGALAALCIILCLGTATASAQGTLGAAPDQIHVGDRIALTVEGAFSFSDTVVVREGYIIRLPSLGDINLSGVTRKNTQPFLTQAIGRFVKDAVVHATPLVRLSISGQVTRPGFYTMPSDIQFSDVVMRAGGPTSESDLSKTVVKRNGVDVVPDSVARIALAQGQTLDQLMIAPGDEVVIGEKNHTSFLSVLQLLGIITPILSLVFLFKH